MSPATRPARSAALLVLSVGCALPLPPGAHYDAPAEDMAARPDVVAPTDATLDAPDRPDTAVDAAMDVPDRPDASPDVDASPDAADRPDVAPDRLDASPDAPDRPDVALDADASLDAPVRPDAAPDAGCGARLTPCAGACRDLQSDRTNCGGCNVACRPPEVCSAGECVGCPMGRVVCGNACVSIVTDPAHCGTCGHACAAGLRCEARVCVSDALLAQRSCATSMSGCGMVAVPGGTFALGAPSACSATPDATCAFAATPPQNAVTVGNFAIDRYEVTVARFRAWMNAGQPAPTAPVMYRGGALPFVGAVETAAQLNCGAAANYPAGGRDEHPINCVDWATAQAFCVWDGGRLPTQAEWEYAARGPGGRLYPWGNDGPTDARACSMVSVTRTATCPVGASTSGATPDGIFDLAGNVAEWNADWYAAYASGGAGCWTDVPRTDPLCTDPGAGSDRVYRGGAWQSVSVGLLRAPTRYLGDPGTRVVHVGFRCARDLP